MHFWVSLTRLQFPSHMVFQSFALESLRALCRCFQLPFMICGLDSLFVSGFLSDSLLL